MAAAHLHRNGSSRTQVPSPLTTPVARARTNRLTADGEAVADGETSATPGFGAGDDCRVRTLLIGNHDSCTWTCSVADRGQRRGTGGSR